MGRRADVKTFGMKYKKLVSVIAIVNRPVMLVFFKIVRSTYCPFKKKIEAPVEIVAGIPYLKKTFFLSIFSDFPLNGMINNLGIIVTTMPTRKPISKDRKSTRLNSSHRCISYAVFCLKKKNITSSKSHRMNYRINYITN